jgi:hypothetical protein|tara:strand:+ start:416 stop:589 length:174 start_codon:yes stop_codon:yes gene_type:complete
MNIQEAKYVKDLDNKNKSIDATVDGAKWSVPINSDNRHYAEIMKQVQEGKLTIQDAD